MSQRLEETFREQREISQRIPASNGHESRHLHDECRLKDYVPDSGLTFLHSSSYSHRFPHFPYFLSLLYYSRWFWKEPTRVVRVTRLLFFSFSLSLSLSLSLSFSFFFFFLPNTCTRVAHRPKRRNESHPPAHSAFFQSRTLAVHQTNRKIEFSLQSDLNEGLCVCLFRNQEIFYRFTFRFFEVSVGEKKWLSLPAVWPIFSPVLHFSRSWKVGKQEYFDCFYKNEIYKSNLLVARWVFFVRLYIFLYFFFGMFLFNHLLWMRCIITWKIPTPPAEFHVFRFRALTVHQKHEIYKHSFSIPFDIRLD